MKIVMIGNRRMEKEIGNEKKKNMDFCKKFGVKTVEEGKELLFTAIDGQRRRRKNWKKAYEVAMYFVAFTFFALVTLPMLVCGKDMLVEKPSLVLAVLVLLLGACMLVVVKYFYENRYSGFELDLLENNVQLCESLEELNECVSENVIDLNKLGKHADAIWMRSQWISDEWDQSWIDKYGGLVNAVSILIYILLK